MVSQLSGELAAQRAATAQQLQASASAISPAALEAMQKVWESQLSARCAETLAAADAQSRARLSALEAQRLNAQALAAVLEPTLSALQSRLNTSSLERENVLTGKLVGVEKGVNDVSESVQSLKLSVAEERRARDAKERSAEAAVASKVAAVNKLRRAVGGVEKGKKYEREGFLTVLSVVCSSFCRLRRQRKSTTNR